MTFRIARLLALSAILLSACAASAACQVVPREGDGTVEKHVQSPLEGDWELVGNRFQSRVTLAIRDHDVEGKFGCLAWGDQFEAHSGGLVIGVPAKANSINGLVTDAPCVKKEEESAVAWAYWHRLFAVATTANHYHVEGSILTLSTPTGERLNYRRVG